MTIYSNSDHPYGLVGYVNLRHLLDPHKTHFQSGYVFTYYGKLISWRSIQQTLIAIFLNHAEILALYKASRKCL